MTSPRPQLPDLGYKVTDLRPPRHHPSLSFYVFIVAYKLWYFIEGKDARDRVIISNDEDVAGLRSMIHNSQKVLL